MRKRSLRVLTLPLLASLVCAGTTARALPEPARAVQLGLRIEAKDPLEVGTTAHVDVFVRVPAGEDQPLLLTPTSEGDAVRVVRGRLSRADAERTAQGELRFDLPVVVRSAGAAVLRIDALTYYCTERCEPLRASTTHILHAAAR